MIRLLLNKHIVYWKNAFIFLVKTLSIYNVPFCLINRSGFTGSLTIFFLAVRSCLQPIIYSKESLIVIVVFLTISFPSNPFPLHSRFFVKENPKLSSQNSVQSNSPFLSTCMYILPIVQKAWLCGTNNFSSHIYTPFPLRYFLWRYFLFQRLFLDPTSFK